MRVPQQENSVDCGVFVLENLRRVLWGERSSQVATRNWAGARRAKQKGADRSCQWFWTASILMRKRKGVLMSTSYSSSTGVWRTQPGTCF